ncbi:SDR family NAD(P)-dependent oxidoreductase [Novosphingobium album (ex Hu et al. 2023)]|uniref:SDR family oxidoreductase n=1 Tax=Novosphingobium album (ex Hu et al. 2023) TaxID=2930093 RepID=A0ABT0B5F8_9SPHN|nr:SDR family oxidoreductase [Novosphingobium album (ex Hu et al. 2023)]MCJ2180248.1 SDR family oxidoreductase [Novosphingobium album (ex Hu et al. 2023)]
MGKLEKKVILIAGAGGIGAGLAQRYADEGAHVVLGDIDQSAAERVVTQIRDGGGEAAAIRLDGTDEASALEAVAFCRDTYGGLDGVHANFASLADSNPQLSVIDLPFDIFDEVQRVNARGFFVCTRAALPALIDRGGGSIVYTSSAAAYDSGGGQVAYAMSKAAGQALMRHVARRFGPDGVRANTIAPALTLHPGIADMVPSTMIESAKSKACIKSRVGVPGDIAAAGTLLMSDEGSYITGQVINVDGGTVIRS